MDVARLHDQLAAIGHRITRIDAQVQYRAFELVGITQGQPKIVGEHELQLNRMAQRACQQITHRCDQNVAVHRRRTQRLAS
jgi:hypothetical protein